MHSLYTIWLLFPQNTAIIIKKVIGGIFMVRISSFDMYCKFEKIVADIFRAHGFSTTSKEQANNIRYDILATKDNVSCFIEVKYSRTNSFPSSVLYGTALRLKQLIVNQKTPIMAILVIGAKLNTNIRTQIENMKDIIIIDIANLLFLVQNNESLKQKLLSILEFSVNDLIPEQPNLQLFNPPKQQNTPSSKQGDLLKKRIRNWVNSNNHTEYENLCTETLRYLFNDELSLWHRQQTSNDELYRFDLICKIKDGEVSGLWSTILQCLNSKYIIFEFKNYKKEITQKEIYTTDKYLYLKALRGVAIIVSCKGTSKNAEKAIKGTLRENGKLILSIDNSELIKMIDIKMSDGIPADYLYAKFDKLLIDLEK